MEALGINLPGLITSIVSFLILFGILRAVLYKPMLKMIDNRSARIRNSLEAADRAQNEADRSQEEMQSQIETARNEGQSMIAQAKEIADRVRQEELAKASDYIKTDQAKWAAQAAIAKGKADVQVHLQSMRDATAIEVERIRAMTKGLVTNEKGLQEQTELQMKQRHAREMSTQHILSGEHAQAMKAAQAQELEAIKVEGEVTRDAISAEIDVEKDAAMRKTPEVKIDVDLPLEK